MKTKDKKNIVDIDVKEINTITDTDIEFLKTETAAITKLFTNDKDVENIEKIQHDTITRIEYMIPKMKLIDLKVAKQLIKINDYLKSYRYGNEIFYEKLHSRLNEWDKYIKKSISKTENMQLDSNLSSTVLSTQIQSSSGKSSEYSPSSSGGSSEEKDTQSSSSESDEDYDVGNDNDRSSEHNIDNDKLSETYGEFDKHYLPFPPPRDFPYSSGGSSNTSTQKQSSSSEPNEDYDVGNDNDKSSECNSNSDVKLSDNLNGANAKLDEENNCCCTNNCCCIIL